MYVCYIHIQLMIYHAIIIFQDFHGVRAMLELNIKI